MQPRINLQNDLVLVSLRIDGRYLPLRERIVQSVIDVLNLHAKTGGGLPVDKQVQRQTGGVAVARNIRDAFNTFEFFRNDWRPLPEQIEIRTDERVLIVGVALASAGAQILRGKHEQPDARHRAEIAPETIDDLCGRQTAALIEVLQADEHGAAIGTTSARPAAAAKARTNTRNSGISHHDIRDPLLETEHGLE